MKQKKVNFEKDYIHMFREFWHFIIHLRLHYQVLILSGGYLLGGLMADQMDPVRFGEQFLNVHILLFGGATAYNSFWDKDTGPIGGLKFPPEMKPWMHKFSLLFMFLGWGFAAFTGPEYFIIYGLSLLFFWLYSTPHARWKGHPYLSLVAIGMSTGFNSVLLGFLAAGGVISSIVLLCATGTAFILLSLYPVSQIYQVEEDAKRGDQTFAIRYDIKGVKSFFVMTFFPGLILLCSAMFQLYSIPAIVLFITGLCSGFILWRLIFSLKGEENEYSSVMRIKFFASFSFVFFLIMAISIRYGWITALSFKEYF
ncbi:MAG: UbiA family prenyltransferase [Balneolaceae bacterium]